MSMQDWQTFFKGKKITVMGIGLQGGVGDIRFLAEQGAELIVTDLKPESELMPAFEILKDIPNISYTLGRHELADFHNRDLIIKAPGTPIDSPYIAEARAEGTPITMWAALLCRFARDMQVPIIGVTGTRGKTSVTLLIAHLFEHAGRSIITGGNVQGTAILSRLPDLTPNTTVILELDSWKLQGFAEEQLSPDIAVFTTFYADHMNYYKGDLNRYFMDKAEIFLHQKEGDLLIVGTQVAPLISGTFGTDLKSRLVNADATTLPHDWNVRMPGEHNRYNAGIATSVAREVGIAEDVIKEAIESFPGVPGRLELVAEKKGIRFYNDTTATTPEGTIVALQALSTDTRQEVSSQTGTSNARIILIAGGADKDLDMRLFVAEVNQRAQRVFLLAGSGTERIKEEIVGAIVCDSLLDAFRRAVADATPGDIVLLSPGFASFGMFKNEYERGDQFRALVQAYDRDS